MTNDIDEKIKDLDDTMQKLNGMIDDRIEGAHTAIKKGVVQTAILAILSIAIYIIWGATWYFWVVFAITFVFLLLTTFAVVMLNKAKRKIVSR
jgi:hypothetical protein